MKRTSWKDPKRLRSDKVLLDRNENCDYQHRELVDMFLDSLDSDAIVLYPNLAKAYEAVMKLGYDPDCVLLTAGAEDAIRSIIARTKIAKSISYLLPTYGMLTVFADIYKLIHNVVVYNDDFTFCVDAMSQGDIVYLANPDNPTGTLVDGSVISHFCEKVSTVIVDETYGDFSGTSAADLLSIYDNLYVVKSFSKSAGAAGIRLGMVLSSKANIQKLIDFKPAYEINAIACEFLSYIARHQDELIKTVYRISCGKKLLETVLIQSGYVCRETHANFVLVAHDDTLLGKIKDIADVSVIEIAQSKYIRITAPDEVTVERIFQHGICAQNAEVDSIISHR